MKICKRCHGEFDERDDALDAAPPERPGGFFITCMGHAETENICGKCKEELGMMNLLGFER
jgi:hypothetical protein